MLAFSALAQGFARRFSLRSGGLAALLCVAMPAASHTAYTDSAGRDTQPWAIEMGAAAGRILATDAWIKQWLREPNMRSAQIGLRYRTATDATDSVARDYGFPELGLHLSWGDFSGVKMQKTASPDWGLLEPVDYVSDMGQLITAHFSFSRPLWHGRRWALGYALEHGLAYNSHPYRKRDNIDNELTGSRLLIYFGASVYGQLRLNRRFSLRADFPGRHVSNGASTRPNKGANYISPQLTLQYDLDETAHFRRHRPLMGADWKRGMVHRVSASIGAHSLLEDWLQTQYSTPPDAPNYRTDDAPAYPTYNFQYEALYRYSRRFASGLSADFFVTPYVAQLRERYAAAHPDARYSPISVGIALRHEAHYGPLALYIALGHYLHRQVGHLQPHDETPYYQRAGLRYTPRALGGLSVAAGIKAHKGKADFAEFIVGYEF